MKKILIPMLAALVAATASAATDLTATIRQDWPWSTKVYIDVTMPSGTNDLALVASFVSGGEVKTYDIASGCPGVEGKTSCVAGGACHVTWDPVASGFTGEIKNLQISAKAVSANERAWLVLDCDTGDYRYVALGDEPKSSAGWPWTDTDKTKDKDYRLRYMVFRRIPAGKAMIGYTDAEVGYLNSLKTGGNNVTDIVRKREIELTSDYYIGIFPVTVGQAVRLTGEFPSDNYRYNTEYPNPGDWVGHGYPCYQRGSNSVDGINWPVTKFAVKSSSQIGKARAKFNNRFMIDLPTAAQWQRAARPDVSWLWYDTPTYGGGTTSDGLDTIKQIVNTIARGYRTQAECKAAGYGDVGAYGPVTKCGWFQPNAFGLYDLLTMRREMTLDAWKDLATMASETVDPIGPTNPGTNKRVNFSSYSNDGLKNPANYLMSRVYTVNSDISGNSSDECIERYVIHLNPPASFNGVWK